MLSENKKTSIKIDPEIWKQLKIVAIKNNMKISELIEKIVKDYLTDQEL